MQWCTEFSAGKLGGVVLGGAEVGGGGELPSPSPISPASQRVVRSYPWTVSWRDDRGERRREEACSRHAANRVVMR